MKFAKVLFLHLSVSHSVHRGVSSSVHAGIHPPGQTPPSPLGRHPPGADTPRPMHAGRYTQQAGSTHPTGMHACLIHKSAHVHRFYFSGFTTKKTSFAVRIILKKRVQYCILEASNFFHIQQSQK